MANVDERVVSMKFDNKDFEKNTKETMTTLEKLKQSLSFEGITEKASSIFDKLSNTIRKSTGNLVDLNTVSSQLDELTNKFSASGEAIRQIYRDVTQKVEEYFNKLYSFVVKEPLSDGFKEYELKMDSVQTIMASTGATLEEVDGYLAELNTYADKTIYSFKDMTASIGKFTNSGVQLEDAVKAIQGVSNVAAVSGANAQQASHAMYNFAQALSSGSVKLIDWKSIENANMATVEFKQTLIDTALELGTVVKEGDEYRSVLSNANGQMGKGFTATKGFNDELQYQWMTTDVLVAALSKYTDETTELGKKAFAAAQDVKTWTQLLDTLKEAIGSGWGRSFELIFGNFEQAKELFTKVNNVLSPIVDKVSDFRNTYIQAWVDNGGRDKAIEKLEKFLSLLESAVDKGMEFADVALKTVLGPEYEKIFGNLVSGLEGILDAASKVISKKDLDRWQVAYDIWTKASYGVGEERKRAIEEMFQDNGESYDAVQAIIEDIIAGNVQYEEGLQDIKKRYEEQQAALENSTDEINRRNGLIKQALTFEEKMVIVFTDIRQAIGDVWATIQNVFEASRNISDTFFEMFGDVFDFTAVSNDISGIAGDFRYFSEVILGASDNATSLKVIFTRFFNGLNSAYSSVSGVIGAVRKNISDIFDTLTSNPEVIEKILNTFHSVWGVVQSVARGASNVIQSFVNIGGAFVNSFLTTFDYDKVIADFKEILDIFVNWTENIKNSTKNTDRLKRGFDVFFSILNVVYAVVSRVVKTVIKIGAAVVETIFNIISAIKSIAENSDEDSLLTRGFVAIKTIIANLIDMFKRIKDILTEDTGNGSILDKIMDFVATVGASALELIVSLLESIASFDFSKLDFSWLTKIADFLFGDSFGKGKNPFEIFGDWLKEALSADNIKLVFDWAVAAANAVLSAIGSLDWTTIWTITSFVMFVAIGMKIVKALKSITGLMTSITDLTNSLTSSIKDIGSAIKTKILGSVFNTTLSLIVGMLAILIIYTEIPQERLTVAATIMISVLLIIKQTVTAILDTVNTTHTSNSRLEKLTKFMTGMAAIVGAIAALMIAMAVMSYIFDQTEHPIKLMILSILMFAAIGGVVAGLMFALKKWGTSDMPQQFKGLRDGLLGLAAAVGAMALIAYVIEAADISWNAIAKTLVMLIVVAGVMFGLMVAVKKWNKGAKALQKFAKAMIVISVALDLLIPVFVVLGLLEKLTGGGVVKIALSIAMIIAAMGILIVAIGKATSGVNSSLHKKILLLAVSLAIVVGAITALLGTGGVLAIFDLVSTDDGFKKFLFILGSITLAIIAFTAGFAILAFVISKAPNVGAALLEVATAIALTGVGLIACAAAMWIFIYAMTQLPEAAQGIVGFVQTLEENGPILVKTVTVLCIMLIGAVLAAFAVMKGSTAIQIITFILYILIIAATFLHGHVNEAADFLGMVIADIVSLLGKTVKVVAQGLVSLIILVIGEVCKELIRITPTLVEVLWIAVKGIIRNLFAYIIEEIFKGLSEFSGVIADAFEDMGWDGAADIMHIWEGGLDSTGRTLGGNLREAAENDIAEIDELTRKEYNSLQGLSDKVGDKWNEVKDSVMGGEGLFTNTMDKLGINSDSANIDKVFDSSVASMIGGSLNMKSASKYASNNILESYGTLDEALNAEILDYDEWLKANNVDNKFNDYIFERQSKQIYEKYKEAKAAEIQALYDSKQNTALFDGINVAALNTNDDFMDALKGGFSVDQLQSFMPEGMSLENFDMSMIPEEMQGQLGDLQLSTGEGGEFDMSAWGLEMGEDTAEGIEFSNEEFEDAGATVAGVLMDSFENITAERAEEAGKALSDGTIKSAGEHFSKDAHTLKKKAEPVGDAIAEGVKKGYVRKQKDIAEEAKKTGDTLLLAYANSLGIASPSKEMMKMGRYTIDGLIFGLKQKNKELEEMSSTSAELISDSIKQSTKELSDYVNDSELLYSPVISPKVDVTDFRISNERIDAIKTAIEIAKDYIKNAFDYEPVLKPAIDISGLNYQTEQSKSSIFDALKSPMDFLISYFNGELEYDPSIRPTMDISDVRYGTGLLNNMLASKSYEVGAEVNASMNQIALDKMDYMEAMRTGYNDGNVIGAIGKLNNDINSLNESMSNMTVVMDTGALVGSIAEPVDYALGQRQYMRGRGM